MSGVTDNHGVTQMLTEGQRESDNVEDRRGIGGRGMAVGGGIGTVVIAIIVWLMGGDPRAVINSGGGGGGGGGAQLASSRVDPALEKKWEKTVRVTLGSTEDGW